MKLTEKQKEANALLTSSAKHVLFDGGSRSGKTFLLIRAICTRAIKAPRSRHAILRFRFAHVKEAIGMDTLPKVMRECYPQIPCNINKSDWYLQLPNESEIWLGGIDDKDRTEKILGKEFATIFLNECSQIPYASRNIVVTRLAQRCDYELGGVKRMLALKMYYDQNPPSKAHWAYQMFYQKRDPETKQPLIDADNYAHITLNPRDNLDNLPPDYIDTLERLPARLRSRFLDGKYGDVAEDALWTEDVIDRNRVMAEDVPQMLRIVVAVDPSGSADDDNANNDEIGIMVVGLGHDGNAYVLDDCTVKAGPATWGKIATTAYDRHMANMIVAETNFGGDMVRFVVQAAKPNVPFKKITASRGKAVRAEPVSVLHHKGQIKIVDRQQKLEDELCAFTSRGYMGEKSPNRADAFVWAINELFPSIMREEIKQEAAKIKKPAIAQEYGWMS